MRLRGSGWAVVLLAALGGVAPGDEGRAVAALQKLGARVGRDETRPGRPVVRVELSAEKGVDLGLKELVALERLEALSLARARLTRLDMNRLATLHQLRKLTL